MKTVQHHHFAYADNGGPPIAFAHRGGNAAGADKENSLAAFQSAVELGYEYLETDVVRSADGKVVVAHGSRNFIDRFQTGLPLRSLLQSMTYEQILKHTSAGGEPYPLLEEVLREFPDTRINIDPKTNEVVEPLAKIIGRMGVVDRVGIANKRYKRTLGVAEALGGQNKVWTALSLVGVLALKTSFSPLLAHTRAAGFQLRFDMVSEEMVSKSHDYGLDMHVWTPNTPEEMINSLKMEVDGVMTDNVYHLKEVMQDKGLWRGSK